MTELSPQLFTLFAGLVEEAAGLHYGPADRELFGAKLIAHAADRGHDMLLDYYYRLRYDDADRAELASLIEVLLVHETYLFRELDAVQALVDTQLVPAVRARGRARVWSAACSTGEEPFTLAMLLDARGVLDAVEIVATDLSPIVVERARRGHFGRRALRDGHPPELAARYTAPTSAGFAVAPRIRDAVDFATLNLVDDTGKAGLVDHTAATTLGQFDAILCRNVLIYFRDEQILRVIDRLVAHLAPGGLLAVGVSESLLRFGTKLICEERGRSFFYRSAA